MGSLWTWGGTYFGRREENSLFTHNGVEVGQFHGDEIYGEDGRYLGELKSGKLVTNTSKTSQRRSGFSPRSRMGYIASMDYVGSVMYAGYDDFPDPNSFR